MAKNKIEELSRNLEITGALSGGAHIELFSNKEAIIDGIKGVIEYSDCFIKLNAGRGTLEFWGTGLQISSLDADGIVICGKIEKLEFCM